jgi:hypothetical protein
VWHLTIAFAKQGILLSFELFCRLFFLGENFKIFFSVFGFVTVGYYRFLQLGIRRLTMRGKGFFRSFGANRGRMVVPVTF